MGPRLVGRGKTAEQYVSMLWLVLQWGRVLWDAERATSPRTRLSTNYTFNGAASCGTRKVWADNVFGKGRACLQWGRVLWDAESHSDKCCITYSYSFNGAASCGTRKVVSGARYCGLVVGPSMGPRLVGRGKRDTFAPSIHAIAAFNGAASCGTRKVYTPLHLWSLLYPLQWGRVLWDAERVLNFATAVQKNFLQWGRVLWDAESTGSGPARLGRAYLQWGRVLWDAESSCGASELSRDRILQWGRVLWDAERRRPNLSWQELPTFNGAASCGTRKDASFRFKV